MPVEFRYSSGGARTKVYRGFYGAGAQMRIAAACRRRRCLPVFPDCRSY